jgi:hypothetical protein
VTADEEYVLTLNGKQVGAGAWRPGAPLDVYEVGPLLLTGGNRLVAELRSSRGSGGLLVSLEDVAAGRFLVGTDERWRIFPHHQLGVVRGWLPLALGEPVHCWGVPPVGRWGLPGEGPVKPLLGRLTGAPLPAVSARPLTLALGPAASAETAKVPGSPVLYDWGREVAGYLTLEVRPAETQAAALLFTGNEPPDPLRERPASILVQPGRRDWMDSRPRRFRYAVLVGLAPPAAVTVLPVPPGMVPPHDPEAPQTPETSGVFGIAPPPLRTPVEHEVWSKLQRLAGVAGRKEL